MHVCKDKLVFDGRKTQKKCDAYAYSFTPDAGYSFYEYVSTVPGVGEPVYSVLPFQTTAFPSGQFNLEQLGICTVVPSVQQTVKKKSSELDGKALLYNGIAVALPKDVLFE